MIIMCCRLVSRRKPYVSENCNYPPNNAHVAATILKKPKFKKTLK